MNQQWKLITMNPDLPAIISKLDLSFYMSTSKGFNNYDNFIDLENRFERALGFGTESIQRFKYELVPY